MGREKNMKKEEIGEAKKLLDQIAEGDDLALIRLQALLLNQRDDAEKYMPPELYNALARLTTTTSLETIALREIGGHLKVYLTKRRPDDVYSNSWHVPGTVLRVRESFEDALQRLSESEYGTKIISYNFIGMTNNRYEARGHFVSPVFLVALSAEPKPNGEWVECQPLRADSEDFKIIWHHREYLIPMAVLAHNHPETRPAVIQFEKPS